MFDNIGHKIKWAAGILEALGFLHVILAAIFLPALKLEVRIIGTIAGGLVVWIIGSILYGIGQLIENTEIIKAILICDMKDTKWNARMKKQAKKILKIEADDIEE